MDRPPPTIINEHYFDALYKAQDFHPVDYIDWLHILGTIEWSLLTSHAEYDNM